MEVYSKIKLDPDFNKQCSAAVDLMDKRLKQLNNKCQSKSKYKNNNLSKKILIMIVLLCDIGI